MKPYLFRKVDQLSDQERIRRLEQTVRLQTAALLLLSICGVIAAWRIRSLSEIGLLFDERIALISENTGLIIDCLQSVENTLQQVISFLVQM